jgi:RNA polymerase sigma factor (TIGR02999 family)
VTWQNRAHFFGAAARAMRRILIDRARSARSARRGRLRDAPLPDESVLGPDGDALGDDSEELLALDGALESLRGRDERQHEVVMLRYFGGLTVDQSADVMGVSPATVKNEWAYARAWLLREMEKRAGADES